MQHSRRMVLIGSLGALLLAAGCTARPLYSAPSAGGYGMSEDLSAIAIKPVKTRYGQEVRNQLIFMFAGGKGEPAEPRYSLDLTVAALRETATYRQSTDDDSDDLEPTAATMTLTGNYTLTAVGDGAVVAKGQRQVTSSFDVPRQSFAEMRAERDAENRAARELAEMLRMAIAQDLSRR